MSIFAFSDGVLAIFSDLLHDLYFPVPAQGFAAVDGQLTIVFADKDGVIDKNRKDEFRLVVHNVVKVHYKGKVEELPGPEVELNKIVFDRQKRQVIFKNVHPYELFCEVTDLKLELDQITTSHT